MHTMNYIYANLLMTFFPAHECPAFVYVCIHMCLVILGTREGVGFPELELQMAVQHHMGAGN